MQSVAIVVAVCVLVLSTAVSNAPAAEIGLDPNLIVRDSLMKRVERLAAPELAGRVAGSPGYFEAAREAAAEFARLGLRPGGSPAGSWFQELQIEYNPIEECALALVGANGSVRELEPGREFACRGLTGSGNFTAPVVFVGYGLSRPELGYDDYAGLDVNGKVVLAFKEAPPFRADSTGWGESWMPRPKGLVAAAHGARGLLIAPRPNTERPQWPIASMLEGDGAYDPDFPRLQIDLVAAEELVASAGLNLRDLQTRIDSTHAPASAALAASARIGVRARYEPRQTSVNIVGILEGSDPMLKEEVIVLGAHLDHVGSQGPVYYPGANDNASGSAAVLAAARALSRAPSPPRRTIIFGLWSSEEAGLYGARRFVDDPPVPRERIVAYLNFDCVGHGDSIQVGGGETYRALWEVVRDIDRAARGLVIEETWGGGGADAEPFEEAGIPNLYFASHFSYAHLHRPSDTPETLNPAVLEAVARLGASTAWRLAQDGVPVEAVE